MTAQETRPSAETTNPRRIGHVNLSVSDLERSLAFYQDALGMRVTKRLEEAAFLSFGSYHHDLCINTWQSKGGSPRPQGATGLYHFAVAFGELAALQDTSRRLGAAGIAIDDVVDHGVSLSAYLRDPDQNGVELTWDRPAESWWSAEGALRMGHRRISLEQLLAAEGAGLLQGDSRAG
ncbi:VOC family protein [Roseomonas sp. BN140053]|uniref:VOC family protein n=1 Tax=Roseomonas sp. BN140053 TaxID=3391898 RepID=UPI0039EBE472